MGGMSEPNLRELKVRAQALKPSIKLGKAGLTPEFLAAFDEALTRAKLLKVRFEGFKEERKTVAKELAEKTSSLLVQQVGYTAVYFRETKVDG
jgi:RNA-binding protein